MPQQQEQGWAGKEWRDNLGVPFLCKLSHSWSSLDIILSSLGKPIQAQPEVGRVSRMGLEGEVPPWAGSPWMGSFTATLISGFAYPCKTKYHCWLISPELFPNCFSFESLGFGLSLKKNICAPSPKVSLYQLASDFPKLNFGCNNSQDGKMCSCPEICLSLLFIQDSDGNNSSHEIKKKKLNKFALKFVLSGRTGTGRKFTHMLVAIFKYHFYLLIWETTGKCSSFLDHLYLSLISPLKTSFHGINVPGLSGCSPPCPHFLCSGKTINKIPFLLVKVSFFDKHCLEYTSFCLKMVMLLNNKCWGLNRWALQSWQGII